ncbi:LptF/LptG family permease [Hymenobacter psychrotolerans]|uniref:Lipopolysaccharide export system permease protein n=1 Tax=Hymenobacter psychrotolerans DSM 18569 TaxID=1121959 RepID=A0A1M7CSV3_9BACT|nr:LptF/LptG family permease [Hymenobacter psychrotolerans]SHL70334.1 lipopolysaccharide export system permease protein [Hymenobacter psychrotolerans DSM 18569]
MLRILDKYILKKFLTAFFFTVVVLVMVICVIDFTEKNDDFIQHNLGAWKIITEYYVNLFPYYANLLSPITVFIAVVFVTAQLAARTEIVAILASGVSFKRLLVPYMMGSLVLAVVTVALTGWIIPNANKTRVEFERRYIKNPYRFSGRNVHIKVGPTSYAFMESYDNVNNVGYKFALETIEGTLLKRRMTAEAITWDSTKRAWRLTPQLVRTFRGQQETLLALPARDTTLNLYPKDFASTYRLSETLTLPELNAFIQQKIDRGASDTQIYLSEKYERYAYPYAIFILTIIGVIMSARKSRAGVGGQIALGFVLAFVFIIFVILSRNFAQVGSLSPLLAAWIPSIVFTGIGLVLYRIVPR